MADHKSSGWIKWIFVLLLLAGIGYGVFFLVSRKGEKETEYKSVTVGKGDLTQVVTATGTLNPLLNVQVGSQISGTIQKIMVDFNSPVKEGDLIAQIDAATYQASVHQAEGDLANAKAGFQLAQLNATRAEELLKSKLISQADADKAKADRDQSAAQVKLKEASLERAKVDLARCNIYAPVSGIVISRSVDVGQTVAASLNTPTLFVIANDLAKMQIDANVSEADIGGVEAGQDVNFTVDAFPTRTFRGKVTQVRNAATTVQNVVTYDAVIGVSNSDLKLKPGMTANVSIVVAHRENVITVPNAALRFRPPETTASKKPGPGGNSISNAPGGAIQSSPPVAQGQGQSGSPEGAPAEGGGRRRRQGGGSGGTGGEGSWSGRRAAARGEQSSNRTVYLAVPSVPGQPQPEPKPVQIKIGISDGISTEVVEGLKEGDNVVTGVSSPSSAAPTGPSSSPFGGGMRRF